MSVYEDDPEFSALVTRAAASARPPGGPVEAATSLEALYRRHDFGESPEHARTRVPRRGISSNRLLAAGLSVLVVAGIAYIHHTSDATMTGRGTPAATYVTKFGERSTVTLHDGSRIVLAPGSALQVDKSENENARVVRLQGEAYFEVPSAVRTPFLVRAGTVTTRVLGTAFTVRRQAATDTTHVATLSGRVVVANGATQVTLSAGKVAHATDSTITTSVGVQSYTDWTKGRLIFDETPVHVMLADVGRWYGYQFKLADSALTERHVSAVFEVSNPQEMMVLLKGLLNVSMTFDGRTVTLIPLKAERRAGVTNPAAFKPSTNKGR